MHRGLIGLLGACLLVAGLPAQAGHLSVAFLQPELYTDAGYSHRIPTDRERQLVQRDIEQHLQRLAERGLAAGDSLRIEVLDIDLAGHFEPGFRSASDMRVVRDITWPRIKLRYTLSRGAQVLASAEEQVSDMNFLMATNRYSSTDRLRYERAMLDDWFERRIGKR